MSAASSSSSISSSSRSSSMTPSLTPSCSPSPQPSTPTDDDNDIPTIPVQPDHFWGADEDVPSLPNPLRPWLDPNDDPLAHRGIPVFKPTIDEFEDFETYMNRVECWGMKSGIIKIIPPKEWTEALPKLKDQLRSVKIKSPIEQIMFGSNGLFRQENLEKRKVMSVREWAELCARPEFCAPSVKEVVSEGRRGVRVHRAVAPLPPRKSRKKAAATTTTPAATATPEVEMQTVEIKPEEGDEDHVMASADDSVSNAITAVREESVNLSEESPAAHADHEATPTRAESEMPVDEYNESKSHHEDDQSTKMTGGKNATAGSKPKPSRPGRTREVREAHAAERAAQDAAFIDKFDPHRDWLPQDTTAEHYTDEFCRKLERQYWRNCGLSTPAWYGADTAGSLYLDETKSWNVAHLDSALSRLMPSTGVPGVTTPYLYFGMWRATFAWHVEDMDLFSINYIHFGAPKFWYAIPQGRATALEQTMRSYFPKDTSQCPQFLRHKSFLASPTLLAKTSCRPNVLVQREGEFVITFPRGYHAGFNLGFNCAESVNFALESWLELGRRAQVCKCVSDSVRIDVDQLLLAREAEKLQAALPPPQPKKPPRKSKPKSASANGGPESSTSTSKAHPPSSAPRKRKSDTNLPRGGEPKAKKPKKEKSHKLDASAKEDGRAERPALPKISVKLKLPAPEQPFPCCLCVSMSREGLLRVLDPPVGVKDPPGSGGIWKAHESCASVVPETWVDDVELSWTGGEGATAGVGAGVDGEGGEMRKEKVVYGVDGIPKDRWNLKCTACIKTRHKAHGAPIQCTKGKCPRAFHVSCARDGAELGIVYEIVREVEKEVVLIQPTLPTTATTPAPPTLAPDPNPDSVALSLSHPDPVSLVTPDADAAAGTAPPPISSEQPMEVDGTTGPEQRQFIAQPTDPQVLKIIRKQEIKCLCSQHNPDIAAAKRAQRQSKIKTDLLALPAMSRIRVRGDSGVYEVSLLRVNEEAGSVDVIWDGGSRKEIKWGRVIFGDVSGKTIVQKPSEPSKSPTQVDSSKLFIPPIKIPASSNNHTTGSSSYPTTTATVAKNGGTQSAPYSATQMSNYGYYYHYYYAQAQAAAASGIAPYYGPTYQPYPSSSHQPYPGPPASYPYAAVPYTASSSPSSNSPAPNTPSQNSANPSQAQQQSGSTVYVPTATTYQSVPSSSYQVYTPPGAVTPVNQQPQQQAYRDIRWQEPYKQKEVTTEPERSNSAERNSASAAVDKNDSVNASGPAADEGGASAISAPMGASPLTSSLPPPPPSAADMAAEAPSTLTTISNPPLQSPISVQ